MASMYTSSNSDSNSNSNPTTANASTVSSTVSIAAKIEARGSGYSQYSPVSTLERQYNGTGPGSVCLFVQTNANCCSQTVESILKLRRQGATAIAKEQQDLGQITTETNNNSNNSSNNNSSSTTNQADTTSADPFSFLNDASDTQVTTDASHEEKKSGFTRFFKKVAKTTTQQLERGMHGLAVRADQGRNPDLLMVGLYNHQEELLLMTESVPLPDQEHRQNGVRFAIPLQLPAGMDATKQVSVKLWIRSGAALLQQTKAAKNYLIGSVHLQVGQIRQSLDASPATFFHATLQSAAVANGQLTFCATRDLKFPTLCGAGWSLSDPDATAGYASGLFNQTLHQPYGLAVPNKSAACLVAVERTTESTLVLPVAAAVAAAAAAAAKVSLQRAETVAAAVLLSRHDTAVGEYADCNIGIGFLKTDTEQLHGAVPVCSAAWQRPDAIFEVQLLAPVAVPVQPRTEGVFQSSGAAVRFFPKPCRHGVLPAVLHAAGGLLPPTGFFLGAVRLVFVIPRSKQYSNAAGVVPENSFGGGHTVAAASALVGGDEEWECIIGLESLLQRPPNTSPVVEYPVCNTRTGQIMGAVVLSVTIQMQQGPPLPTAFPPSEQGLVSLTGLLPLTDGAQPALEFDSPLTYSDAGQQRRQQQMATMGNFVTHTYLDQHIKTIRQQDTALIGERALQYRAALETSSPDGKLAPDQDRTPKPFRPSASRPEVLLSGIGFNVHNASLEVKVLDPDNKGEPAGGVFHNITCGAPADHARGFNDVFASNKKDSTKVGFNSPVGPAAGGLRRLEAKREELAKEVTNLQTNLTMGVANYFVEARQNNKVVNHVPSRHAELQGLRWKVFEAVHALHHLTWACAVRRANTFSQALGIAVSSYLASLSDASKLQSAWPDLWARHGYLISYEGMLSAAGKELGMIEDASVAISMLRNVTIVLIPDDGAASPSRVPVPSSSYIKWIDMSVSKIVAETFYTLQIGVVPSYFEQRIPAPLKGTKVGLYPVLFEVGVDIRQWGSYAGSNMKSQLTNAKEIEKAKDAPTGGMIDDEDDDVGMMDDDVLVQLNYEAFQKLNIYAFAISPSNTPGSPQKTHPMLEALYQHIVSSSGKISHSILDEAAGLAQQLGGGGAVFCKSGKDRTAMHVTYKQAQFANRYRQQNLATEGIPVADTTLEDAMIIRLYGTRLPICEKNVGESKYAFNSLQVKFMPDELKPPMSALAGFLKGGKVFTGGAIES
jgi:hypothetical protein